MGRPEIISVDLEKLPWPKSLDEQLHDVVVA